MEKTKVNLIDLYAVAKEKLMGALRDGLPTEDLCRCVVSLSEILKGIGIDID